jgi:hypothetical protein
VVRDSVVATTLPDSLARLLAAMDLPMVIERGGIWRRQVETLPYLYSVNRLPTRDAPTAVLLFRPVAQELRIARGIHQSVLGIGLVALVLALVLALSSRGSSRGRRRRWRPRPRTWRAATTTPRSPPPRATRSGSSRAPSARCGWRSRSGSRSCGRRRRS